MGARATLFQSPDAHIYIDVSNPIMVGYVMKQNPFANVIIAWCKGHCVKVEKRGVLPTNQHQIARA